MSTSNSIGNDVGMTPLASEEQTLGTTRQTGTASNTGVDRSNVPTTSSSGRNNATKQQKQNQKQDDNRKEVSHYVVTAHPPGSVLLTCKCNFTSLNAVDILIAKPRRIEVRQLQQQSILPGIDDDGMNNSNNMSPLLSSLDTLPIVLELNNVNGNLVAMKPLRSVRYASITTPIFILQERLRYAVIQYDEMSRPYPVRTLASGSLAAGSTDPTGMSSSVGSGSTTHIHSIAHLLGRTAETGPIVAVDPEGRCIVLHLYDGLLTILPINQSYVPYPSSVASTGYSKNDNTGASRKHDPAYGSNSHISYPKSSILGEPFHCRIEERTILALTFLKVSNAKSTASNVAASTSVSSTQPQTQHPMPLLCLLHQDSRGTQHVTSHAINLRMKQLHLYHSQSAPSTTPWLKKSAVDGGSAILISVPPPMPAILLQGSLSATASRSATKQPPSVTASTTPQALSNQTTTGGILVLGQRQFTYCSPGISSNSTKIVPVPQAMYLTYDRLPDDPMTGSPRYLIGDEFGNLHMLSVLFARPSTNNTVGAGVQVVPPLRVVALQLETLGSCNVSSSISYLDNGLCFVGSAMGDSQLIQIHDEPISIMSGDTAIVASNGNTGLEQPTEHDAPMSIQDEPDPSKPSSDVPDDVLLDLMDTTYISVVEEYTNLGPILDFDLVPTAPGSNRCELTSPVSASATAGNVSTASNPSDNSTDKNSESKIMPSRQTPMMESSSLFVENHYIHQNHLQQNHHQQSQVVTASGTSKSGTIRLIRNGIGMNEYASVAMSGIQAMWSIRKSFHDRFDTYLVQSFVGETRVLGVTTTGSTTNEELMMVQKDDAELENASNDEDGMDNDIGCTLEEVALDGLEQSASSLYVGNVLAGDRLLQITDSEILLIATDRGETGSFLLDTWAGQFTVASANEAGQIVVAMAGGLIVYLSVTNGSKIAKICDKQMDREVSSINLNPFIPKSGNNSSDSFTNMDVDDGTNGVGVNNTSDIGQHDDNRGTFRSTIVAVGLWDDFTVRLLSLEQALNELVSVPLSATDDDQEEDDTTPVDDPMDTTASTARTVTTAASGSSQRRNRSNMMARSLCLITLDFSSTMASFSASHNDAYVSSHQESRGSSNRGVNMLFVGLGDGILLSFVVVDSMGVISTHSRKEVCLGTQCINLVPLNYSMLPDQEHPQKFQQRHYGAGTCVLATGDRPTVIYLAGVGGSFQSHISTSQNINPKLCYSNINVAAGDNDDDGGISRPLSQQAVAINVASPFYSPHLFGGIGSGVGGQHHYSLCVADNSSLRLGVIDDIQKLHVTTCRLGMSPRRIVHCPEGRLFAVGGIESGIKQYGLAGNFGDEISMRNCIRFMDDTTFDDLDRVDLEPFEMILSMAYATMRVPSASSDAAVAMASMDGPISRNGNTSVGSLHFKPFLLVGTGYALPDEDEPTRGRILIYSFQCDATRTSGTNAVGGRYIRQVAEFFAEGGVYSITQFYDGMVLATVNSRAHVCRLAHEETPAGLLKLQYVGNGHFGHILSLFVKSRAKPFLPSNKSLMDSGIDLSVDQKLNSVEKKKNSSAPVQEEMIAIVGDLMRSISLVQYYPQHQSLEEIARDFNVNWTTAVEMLTDSVFLGAENWNNLFCLRRNGTSPSEEVRCRLDTIGEYHLGEMCNKFMSGSLVMPVSTSANTSNKSSPGRGLPATPSKRNEKFSPTGKSGSTIVRTRRPVVVTGSQTLFGTASGTLGVVLGMDTRTAAFFSTLERAMANPEVIRPIGDFFHSQYRACHAERRIHPAHGFVDGDLVESFLDLDRGTMERVVAEMNRDGSWEISDEFATSSSSGGTGNGQDKDGLGECDNRTELTVEYVLAMVEEMTMLH